MLMGSTEDLERRMRRQLHESRGMSGVLVNTAIFVGASWHMLVRERGLRELLLSVLVLWFTYLGSVLAHELGHALVAWAARTKQAGRWRLRTVGGQRIRAENLSPV